MSLEAQSKNAFAPDFKAPVPSARHQPRALLLTLPLLLLCGILAVFCWSFQISRALRKESIAAPDCNFIANRARSLNAAAVPRAHLPSLSIEYVGATPPAVARRLPDGVNSGGDCHCRAFSNFLECDCTGHCPNVTRTRLCTELLGPPKCFPMESQMCECVGFAESRKHMGDACDRSSVCGWKDGFCERVASRAHREPFASMEAFIKEFELEKVVEVRRLLKSSWSTTREDLSDLMQGFVYFMPSLGRDP